MLPVGRSTQNLPSGAADGQVFQQDQNELPGSLAGHARRRSSIDQIMGHIKSVGSGVGSFGSRVMQDLSQPLSAHPQPAQMQRPGMSLPGGFLGMQPQQSSFGSSSGSLGRGGSSANIGGVPDGNSGFPSTTAPPPSSGKGITPAKPIAIPNHHKLPAAEAFLSI